MTIAMSSCHTGPDEKQITHDLTYHHDLDNNDNFSPDGSWLVYDTRTDEGGIAASMKIEKVNIHTQEKAVLFQIADNQLWGPGAGAVSYSPVENAVVFIHGLASSTEANPYQQWRRTGVIIEDQNPNKPIYMDARDVTSPFTPGALRGGTHRHEWSGDGKWVGFTYNDAILKALEDSSGKRHNLRTIGVSKKGNPVPVKSDGENVSGTWFSVLVVRVTPEPLAGSDEISHAASDSWVGKNGYMREDGKRQIARAFLGTVQTESGIDVPEVFIVDIPDDIGTPGEYGPLEGTATTFPMPPKGTTQRRLTYTARSSKPGCSGIVRSSQDGSTLAFLAYDDNGIQQIFLISVHGGSMRQLTFHTSDVSGNLRWHPDGKHVSYIWNGSIMVCETGTEEFEKRSKKITEPTPIAPTNTVWSPDGKTIAFNRLVKPSGNRPAKQQIFIKKVR
jgi:hypothetical protein